MNNHQIEVFINGTPTEVEHRHYTYEEIYNLAFPGQPVPTGKEIPITYSGPKGHNAKSLLPGEKVEMTKGMIINVRPTTKS